MKGCSARRAGESYTACKDKFGWDSRYSAYGSSCETGWNFGRIRRKKTVSKAAGPFRYIEEKGRGEMNIGSTQCSQANPMMKREAKKYCLKNFQAELDPGRYWCEEGSNGTAYLDMTCSNGRTRYGFSRYHSFGWVTCEDRPVLVFQISGSLPKVWTYDELSRRIKSALAGSSLRDVSEVISGSRTLANARFASQMLKRTYKQAARTCSVGGGRATFHMAREHLRASSNEKWRIEQAAEAFFEQAKRSHYGSGPEPRLLKFPVTINIFESEVGLHSRPQLAAISDPSEEATPVAPTSTDKGREMEDGLLGKFGD